MSQAEMEKSDRKTQSEEEPQESLPVGHPYAGYVSPDLSFHEGTGILPEEEKEWHERRNSLREEGVEAVRDSETKEAKLIAEAEEEHAKLSAEARDAQLKKQADAGLIPAQVPTVGEIAAEKKGGSKASKK